jgi:hypothetical protein
MHLLQDVQDLVREPVLLVELGQVHVQVLLADHTRACTHNPPSAYYGPVVPSCDSGVILIYQCTGFKNL